MTSENLPSTETAMTPTELQAILAGAGAIDDKDEGFGSIRMKVTGNTFQTNDDVWMSNPKTQEPAFVARLMGPPEQYQAFWFNAANAERAGRPEMADRMCKSYYDNPQQAREFGTNGAPCRSCLFKPYGDEKQKCGWKGDLLFQILPEDGQLTGEEPLHSLTLSVTGMIEFRGTKRDPSAGSIKGHENFMTKLGQFSAAQASEWGVEPKAAVLIGLEALNEGLVAAEFRIFTQTNEELGRSWPVVSLTPIHVQKPEGTAPAIEAGDEEVIEGETTPATEEEAESTDKPLDSLPF